MSYRNERFNKGMRSLEAMTAEMKDVSKAKVFSDRGEGARAIREGLGLGLYLCRRSTAEDAFFSDAARCRAYEQTREDKLFEAEMRLIEAGKRHLIRVLLLIVENGSDREASLNKVPRRTYFRHRDALISFFCCPRKV